MDSFFYFLPRFVATFSHSSPFSILDGVFCTPLLISIPISSFNFNARAFGDVVTFIVVVKSNGQSFLQYMYTLKIFEMMLMLLFPWPFFFLFASHSLSYSLILFGEYGYLNWKKNNEKLIETAYVTDNIIQWTLKNSCETDKRCSNKPTDDGTVWEWK